MNTFLDDMPIFSPVCEFCIHLQNPTERVCTAFSTGIPREIYRGENDHTEPYPGDRGIQFEEKP